MGYVTLVRYCFHICKCRNILPTRECLFICLKCSIFPAKMVGITFRLLKSGLHFAEFSKLSSPLHSMYIPVSDEQRWDMPTETLFRYRQMKMVTVSPSLFAAAAVVVVVVVVAVARTPSWRLETAIVVRELQCLRDS